MAQIGVPPPCVTLLAEAGISADNLADLPWAVLENIVRDVSGMGAAWGSSRIYHLLSPHLYTLLFIIILLIWVRRDQTFATLRLPPEQLSKRNDPAC